jgi:hypothetical protein
MYVARRREKVTTVVVGNRELVMPNPDRLGPEAFESEFWKTVGAVKADTARISGVARSSQIGLRGDLRDQEDRVGRYGVLRIYRKLGVEKELAVLDAIEDEVSLSDLSPADKAKYSSYIDRRRKELEADNDQFAAFHKVAKDQLLTNEVLAEISASRAKSLLSFTILTAGMASEFVDISLEGLSVIPSSTLSLASKVIPIVTLASFGFSLPGLLEEKNNIKRATVQATAKRRLLHSGEKLLDWANDLKRLQNLIFVRYEIVSTSLIGKIKSRIMNAYRRIKYRRMPDIEEMLAAPSNSHNHDHNPQPAGTQ